MKPVQEVESPRRSWRASLCFGLFAAFLLTPLGGAAAANTITIVVSGAGKLIYLPATLAERLGYFRDAGLEVQLVNVSAGIESQNRLVAGAAQAAVGFYDHTIMLQARGYYVTSLVQMGQAPGEVEVVAPPYAAQITSPAQLQGRRLGVAGLGSSTDALTRYIAHLNGVKYGDYTLVPLESSETMVEAMKKGAVAATMTSEPTARRLLTREGGRLLVDLRTPESTRAVFGGCYPGASLYVRSDWLARHRAEAERLVTAFVRAMRYIAAHSAAEIAQNLPDDFFDQDRPLYLESLDSDKHMFTPDGRMPEGCPAAALKILSSFSRPLREKQIDLARTYTNSLVDHANAALDKGE